MEPELRRETARWSGYAISEVANAKIEVAPEAHQSVGGGGESRRVSVEVQRTTRGVSLPKREKEIEREMAGIRRLLSCCLIRALLFRTRQGLPLPQGRPHYPRRRRDGIREPGSGGHGNKTRQPGEDETTPGNAWVARPSAGPPGEREMGPAGGESQGMQRPRGGGGSGIEGSDGASNDRVALLSGEDNGGGYRRAKGCPPKGGRQSASRRPGVTGELVGNGRLSTGEGFGS